ncbi:MAG: hypothetical protein COU68_03005 [Candidatus Pacebacteria bacterium CG10_big_fil_rev_8_21_14_0_10_45_6]|nr:MAG: hypothetical protein COU68_03005 [Candidatus Pacebacteria bacterium CG10_big_fil_rev_8_21_14_0_10_45_6]
MNDEQKKQVVGLCEADKSIGLLYLFGSRARGDVGPMSDYDFAVQFEGLAEKEHFDKKLDMMGKLSHILKTDAVDLVVLNTLDKPELKFGIVYDGQIVFERGAGRLSVEPAALREYFDFRSALLRFNLTRA